MIYLASPYYHASPLVRNLRFQINCAAAAHIQSQAEVVFSPIAHSHSIAEHLPATLRHSHEFWMEQDLPFLLQADLMFILDLDGVHQSKGVAEEIAFAKKHGINFEYLPPALVVQNITLLTAHKRAIAAGASAQCE